MKEKESLEVVAPEGKPADHKLENLNTELGYHTNSVKRIDEIQGFMNRIDIKGSDAIAMAESFAWLKSVKQNVKFMANKVREEIKEIEAGAKDAN